MTGSNDARLAPLNFQRMPACEERLDLALKFSRAAGECVNTLGPARTSTVRAELLRTYNAMVNHGDKCQKCNEV